MEVGSEEPIQIIFNQIMKLHFLRMHTLLESTNIYPGQPPLLFSLYHNNGQSQKELADNLKIKPSTTTMMIKRLEKNDFVVRKQDEKDQRISRIFITQKGIEVCEDLNRVNSEIEEECFGNFTVEEKIILRRLLLQLRNNLKNVCDNDPRDIEDFCKHHRQKTGGKERA